MIKLMQNLTQKGQKQVENKEKHQQWISILDRTAQDRWSSAGSTTAEIIMAGKCRCGFDGMPLILQSGRLFLFST